MACSEVQYQHIHCHEKLKSLTEVVIIYPFVIKMDHQCHDDLQGKPKYLDSFLSLTILLEYHKSILTLLGSNPNLHGKISVPK
jgi:hypothetical protein